MVENERKQVKTPFRCLTIVTPKISKMCKVLQNKILQKIVSMGTYNTLLMY